MKGYIQIAQKSTADIQNRKALNSGWLLLLITIIFLPQWQHFDSLINNTIAPDLLLRTIGSRLQTAEMPMYQYQWQQGDPVEWLNLYPDLRVGLNGVISTPFTLWLLKPISTLNYCDLKIIWSYLQEFFLFASVWLSCKIFQKLINQIVFLILASIFFIYDTKWLLHLYNGQIYIVYTFFFSLTGYLIFNRNMHKALIFLLPVLSAVRPFFLIASFPFLKLKKGLVICFLSGIIITGILIIGSTNTTEWKQYNHAMAQYAKEATGELIVDSSKKTLNKVNADACIINKTEGFKSFDVGCLYSVQHYLILLGIRISNTNFYKALLLFFLLSGMLLAYKKNWLNNSQKQVVLAFIFYQACELIVPATRNPYNMIQWLPAVAWLVLSDNKKILLLVIVGLYLNSVTQLYKYEREIGEILLLIAMGIFLISKNPLSPTFTSPAGNFEKHKRAPL